MPQAAGKKLMSPEESVILLMTMPQAAGNNRSNNHFFALRLTGNPGITETTETHATTTGNTGTRATTTVSTGTPVTTTTTSVSAGVSGLGAGSASIGAERISTTRTGSEGRGAAALDLQGSTGSQRRRRGTRKEKGGNKRLALKSLTIYFAYYYLFLITWHPNKL